jgi:hypothetical protein
MAAARKAYMVYRDYQEERRLVQGCASLIKAHGIAAGLHTGSPSGQSRFFSGPDVCATWQPEKSSDGRTIHCAGYFQARSGRQDFCSVGIEIVELA